MVDGDGTADEGALAPEDFDGMRVGYAGRPGAAGGGVAADEAEALRSGWFPLFSRWLAEAGDAGVREPNAMVLATSGPAGRPSTRTVLCKGADDRGVRFYTTLTSRKGEQLAATPFASVTFPWLALERQVHLEGACTPLPRAESERYWAVRPRGSQIAAWASHESRPVGSAGELELAYAAAEERFAGAEEVPMPERWGGYLLAPERVEFWRGGRDRFHDRVECRRTGEGPGATWEVRRLQP